MSKSICLHCRASLQQALLPKKPLYTPKIRAYSSKSKEQNERQGASKPLDITALLSKPTWSVRSLLPPANPESDTTPEITSKQLHHLLRLSALPLPSSPEEEASMLSTLHSQLHFVHDIQSVDTEGVEPLQSIRDETEEGIKEATIGLDDLKGALKQETFVGRMRRPRRKRRVQAEGKVGAWDVLKTAGETVEVGAGRYFVVRSGKEVPVKEHKVEERAVEEILEESFMEDRFVKER